MNYNFVLRFQIIVQLKLIIMNRFKHLMLAATLFCVVAVIMSSCSKDDDKKDEDNKLAEKIIGKWMVADLDGQPAPTNLKAVVTFISPTKALGSISDVYGSSWNNQSETDVRIEGNTVTVEYEDGGAKQTLIMDVKSITDTDMQLSSRWTKKDPDGTETEECYTERWIRVNTDYRQAIIGTWEGHITSEQSKYDDGEDHRWEYRADGTYVYYDKVEQDGETTWVTHDNSVSNYIADGTLLCTRWTDRNDGKTELREWWEIESIKDGVMKWTALRMNDDGTTYTATFQMSKVK